MIFLTISALIQCVKIMASEAKETSQLVHGMARIRHIYYVVKHVIKGFLRIVTQSLCIPIIVGKPSNELFWPLPNVTVSGGQLESFP